MIIYITMTLAVILVEIMYIANLPKFRKYITWREWLEDRWDNLTVSFLSGLLLCMTFPELSLFLEDYFNMTVEIHNYPHFGGLVMGLSSTPIINWIMKRTRSKLKDNG
jgi:hypothetical protein